MPTRLTKQRWERGDRLALLIDRCIERHTETAEAYPELAARIQRHLPDFWTAYTAVYGEGFEQVAWVDRLMDALVVALKTRPDACRTSDTAREANPAWFQGHDQVGMMLYVDLFAGTLPGIEEHIPYLHDLGITYLHLMPLLKPRPGLNDGGYAVQDYRSVDSRLGTMDDLRHLATTLREAGIRLVIDFVMNHTAKEHAWAQHALAGDTRYQDYYFMFDDRTMPDAYERTVQDVFPDFAPGSFTFFPSIQKWVWTSFYRFQWDLNYTNPEVFLRMLEEILFLANVGVDGLRLDAVPFLWKRLGTNCLNQPEAHQLLRAYRALVRIAAPGLLFKSEAIVAPEEIVRYLGADGFADKECEVGYNAALMCHLWHALASENTQLLCTMLTTVPQAPTEALWLNYVRCHDDIGWGIDNENAAAVGQNGYDTRRFLSAFFTGEWLGSYAEGYHFQIDRNTGESRTSGTAAALTGLQKAQIEARPEKIDLALRRMLLLHSIVFAMRGMPLLYSGDEIGQLNDFDYLHDPLKALDNRWTHRPPMDWTKAEQRHVDGSVEQRLFAGMQRLARTRKRLPALHGRADEHVLVTENDRLLVVERGSGDERLLMVANFSREAQHLPTGALPAYWRHSIFRDELTDRTLHFFPDAILLEPYQVYWLRPSPDVPLGHPVPTTLTIEVPTNWGEEVYVYGALPTLGDSDPYRALGPLTSATHPTWTLMLDVPEGVCFQFRWLKRRDAQIAGWSTHAYWMRAGSDEVYVLP